MNTEDIANKITEKFRRSALSACNAGIIPYASKDGKWQTSPFDGNSWWTGGFWPALMWQLYSFSGDDFFRTEAQRVENLLTDELRTFEKLNHDVGFMYLLSCASDYRITGNRQSRTDALHAAHILAGRFNPSGFIRAWNEDSRKGYAIIDCMMNLSLLFWASRETGDPRFYKTACIHADTTLREFIRPDGSSFHIVEFDPFDGKRIKAHAGQGCSENSSWSRGQSWALYGFALAYGNTGDKRYLDAACSTAGYFMSHVRLDGLTDCDFCQPADEFRIDNIAGAVASCGLLELERLTGRSSFRDSAVILLDGLVNKCCCWNDDVCGILTHCTASYSDDSAGLHTNITYGDYFFTEAILRLIGKDVRLWY